MESLFVVILFHRKVFYGRFYDLNSSFYKSRPHWYWMRLMLGGYLSMTRDMGLEFVTGRIVRSPYWVKTPKVTYPAKTDVSPERGETPSFRRLKVTPRKGNLVWVLFMKCDVFQSDREATWKWGFSISLLISKAKKRELTDYVSILQLLLSLMIGRISLVEILSS